MKELSVTVPSPDIEITINNNRLRNVTERLMTLSLTDNRGFEADRVTLTIDDADGQLQLPQRGARLNVMIGWRGEALVNKGVYIVDEVTWEGPPDKLTITASSADFREEFNVKREVSWHDVTVKQVVSAIAHRYGLKAQISDILMDIEIDHADQTEESDISFLTRMAEMLGAIATVK
ncbi:contractile injection system protein, VgrG/Pvc8 family, partial [Escherichia coli]|nr:contractile injection system protein, VgrG/Pvc8 family [Escherichia coli]